MNGAFPQLTHSSRKSKIIIQEAKGNIMFRYTFNTENYQCPCNTKKQTLCIHTRYFFQVVLKLQSKYLCVLSVPAIADQFLQMRLSELAGGELNEICRNFLHNHNCDICLDPLEQKELFHCPDCKWVYHSVCRFRWKGVCPRCRNDRTYC